MASPVQDATNYDIMYIYMYVNTYYKSQNHGVSVENDTPRPSPLDIQISLRTLEGRDAICDTSATESLRQRRGNKKRTSFFLGGCPAESPIQWETLETAIVGCLPFGQHIHHQFFWYFRERPQKSPENCCCSIWRSCFFFRPEVVVMDLILCHWVTF